MRRKVLIMPQRILDFDDAVMLAKNWPGIRKARRLSVVNGAQVRTVISVSFWPWTLSRNKVSRELMVEICKRFSCQPPPKFVIMRESAIKRMNKARSRV